jgi:hypothetical protein
MPPQLGSLKLDCQDDTPPTEVIAAKRSLGEAGVVPHILAVSPSCSVIGSVHYPLQKTAVMGVELRQDK